MTEKIDEKFITKYITETFAGVETAETAGDTFFIGDAEGQIPFATIVRSDNYDQFSDLEREGVFRLNIGIGKETYRKLFGADRHDRDEDDAEHYDYTALDVIMPHPVYGRMRWVCVLNPTEETFQTIKNLLAEACEISIKRRARRAGKA